MDINLGEQHSAEMQGQGPEWGVSQTKQTTSTNIINTNSGQNLATSLCWESVIHCNNKLQFYANAFYESLNSSHMSSAGL